MPLAFIVISCLKKLEPMILMGFWSEGMLSAFYLKNSFIFKGDV